MNTTLGTYEPAVAAALDAVRADRIVERIWQYDHTVWRPDPTEIANRLGWLDAPTKMREARGRLRSFADAVRAEEFRHVILLGMGGSSLAPELLYEAFGAARRASGKGLGLTVIDTTDPDMIRARSAGFDLARALVVVATKSGGTVETLSAFKHFYNQIVAAVGRERAGRHFVAITDPGSGLESIAGRHAFRETLLNDPNVGGRYSALTLFGLAPAALVGVDIERLLDSADDAATRARNPDPTVNDAACLGVIIGELARAGRDKLTLITSSDFSGLADWIEQLVAESTGKEGKGILPVVGEPLGPPDVYGTDRCFVRVRLAGDTTHDAALQALAQRGHPVLTLDLSDTYAIGGQFFLWEMATAVAGARLDIQPFEQPNVEAAKTQARRMVAEYQQNGALPHGDASPPDAAALRALFAQARPGDYVAFQAYIHRTPHTDAALGALRDGVRKTLHLATTVGYGPRFLHSTGQLHKGDRGNGLFVQLVSDPIHDLPIPDEAGGEQASLTFGVLKTAQALGDAAALVEKGRRLIRIDLGTDVAGGLERLRTAFDAQD